MNRYKKHLAILIAVIMFATTFTMANPVRVNAEATETTVVEATVTGGVIKFDTSTGTVTGLSGIEDTGALVIPDTIEGVTVKAIGPQAFMSNDSLVSIELPDTVELIDQHAFNNCAALETVKMPANLVTIESYAFSFCYKLKDIELPEGLKYIYGGAFNECTSLTSVNLPASLIDFVKPFLKCTSLTEIAVDSNSANFYTIDGVLFDNDGLVYYPAGKPGSEYTVPDNEEIKYIESSAFSGAVNLTSIHVPGNVKEIKSYAIDSCDALKTVTFDEGLSSLDITAIHNSGIETITLPDSLQSIYRNSLYACRYLKEVNIGAGLSTINYSGTMFTACTALEKINVDENNANYSSVDGVLFDKNQTKLIAYPIHHEGTHYDVPESVTEIEEYAFSSVTRLLTLQIPDSVTTIGNNMLKSSANTVGIYCNAGSAAESYANENGHPLLDAVVEASVTGGVIKFDTATGTVTECVSLDGSGTLEIPEAIENVTVKAIGGLVFSKEQTLTEVILPDTIESIGDEAFLSCYHLEKINMPANLKSIGYMAFYNNKVLTAISLPEQLETIGEEAFSTSALTGSIDVPATVTFIGDAAFAECTGITAINVADENDIYRSDSGVLFNADTLVMYPAGKNAAEYVMPVLEGIKYIESGAFKGADALTKVTIAEGITSIQDEAFYGCESLAVVEFPSTLNILRSKSFGATALTSVTLPDATTRMWSDAFAGCTQLTEVNIPAKAIIYWSNSILSGCTSLTKINIDEDNTTYMSDDGVVFSKDETVLWKYPQNHAGTTYTVPATVKEIHEQAFDGCVNLQEIILQSGLQKIETMAFNNCDSLQSITVPEGVTEIEGYAFSSCDSLKVVTIPSSVTTIGSQMLYNMSQEVVIVCDEGSAAAEYAASNSVSYSYDGKTIVGTGEEFENPDPVEPTQSEQEIVCDETFSKVFGCEDFSLSATAQTALTYKSGNTNIAEVDADGNVTVKAAGVAVITITAAETDEYLAAEKSVTINVSKAAQTIDGTASYTKTYGDPAFKLDATAKTALTYKSDTPAVADVDADGLVTIKGAGTANITIDAVTDTNYDATSKSVKITVSKASQKIEGVASYTKTYGDPAFKLDATAKTALTYKSDNTAVATVDEAGLVTIKGAGTANITINAATDANYDATSKSVKLTIGKASQTIEGTAAYTKTYGDPAFKLDATAKTALTYKSDNTAVADVDADGLVMIKGAGTANITINAATDANYDATSKSVKLTIGKASQIIEGTAAYTKTYGDAAFKLDATAKTALTYKSDNPAVADVDADGLVTIKGAGTANITIDAVTDANYDATSKSVKVTVSKSAQTIDGTAAYTKTYGDPSFKLDATAQTALTYKSDNPAVADVDADGLVTIKGAGTANITIDASTDANYDATSKSVKLTIGKASQIIEGTAAYTKTCGDPAFKLDATAKTALTYKSDNTAVATVDEAGLVTIKGAGTANITIDAATDANYDATSKSVKVTVSKSAQTIDGTAAYTKTYGDPAFKLDATAKTALTYKSDNTAVATVDEVGLVTIKGAGTANITIDAVTDTNYDATSKSVKITVSKSAQTIDGTAAYTKTYGDPAFKLDATAQTALTYKSDNPAVATVDEAGLVTIKGAGTANIMIDAATDANYDATSKSVKLTIGKSAQTIDGTASYTKTYGDPAFKLDATAKTALTYKSDNPAVATVDEAGLVTIKGAGTANITIDAATDANYDATSKSVKITVSKASQKIEGTAAYTKTYGDKAFSLDATAKTALTYKSDKPAVATVDEAGLVTIKGAGTANITIDAATDANYDATSKSVKITVGKATQTIDGTASYTKTYGDAAFKLDATAKTALTYKSDNTAVADVDADGLVTIKGAGTANITINAATDANYDATSKSVKITVGKAAQTIEGTAAYTKTYGDPAFKLDATAQTALTYKSDNPAVATVDEDGLVAIKGAGTANITIDASTDVNYDATSKSVKLTIGKSAQTIDGTTAYTKTYGDAAFKLDATAKTALTYKSDNPAVADVDADGLVTIKGAGTANITIDAATDANYDATSKSVKLTIGKATQKIEGTAAYTKTYGDAAFKLDATAKTALTYKSDNPAVATVDEAGLVTIKGAGTANITINAATDANYDATSNSVKLTIGKATQKIEGTAAYTKTYGDAAFKLDATAKTALTYKSDNPAVATVDEAGLVTIKGAGTANITINAATDANYDATSKSVKLTIGKATQKIEGTAAYTKTFRPNVYFFLKAKSPTKKTYKSSNKRIATVSATGKVTMKNPGKVTITITAQEGKNYKKAVKKVTVVSKMKKPVLTVKAKTGKKNKLSWSKVPGAHGYKVYIYDKSKGKYVCRVTKKAIVKSVTHKGLKAGKTYKYKVRAYRIVNGKMVYSPYSKIKSIKAKK